MARAVTINGLCKRHKDSEPFQEIITLLIDKFDQQDDFDSIEHLPEFLIERDPENLRRSPKAGFPRIGWRDGMVS